MNRPTALVVRGLVRAGLFLYLGVPMFFRHPLRTLALIPVLGAFVRLFAC